jgi:hypothetical protein
MPHNIQIILGDYYPEHVQPGCSAHENLKDAVDAAGLMEMWNMILTLDYSVADPKELSPERRDEFLNVMSLLLKAFDR